MDAGLQLWDPSGVLVVDITSRLTRLGYVGVVSANGSDTNGLYGQGNLFYTAIPVATTFNGANFGNRPSITVSGTTVSWNFPINSQSCLIIIGVYS